MFINSYVVEHITAVLPNHVIKWFSYFFNSVLYALTTDFRAIIVIANSRRGRDVWCRRFSRCQD